VAANALDQVETYKETSEQIAAAETKVELKRLAGKEESRKIKL
jgi:hypothetical protein